MARLLFPALWVLAKLYGAITYLRNCLYDYSVLPSYRSNIPVISIGNLTAGGNGKTPLCIFLAKALKQRGYKPVVLSRGYGGSEAGPLLVVAQHSAHAVGDEPLMLTKRYLLDVVVARDRVSGVKFIEESKAYDIIILDDGFQHRRLKRNVEIVTQDISTDAAVHNFIAGRLLPLGRFRENRTLALRRAEILMLSKRSPLDERKTLSPTLLQSLPNTLSIYSSSLQIAGAYSLKENSRLEPCEVVVFTAIANSEAFVNTLESAGFTVRKAYCFSDHYYFQEADLETIYNSAGGAPLVCTEKDAVKVSDNTPFTVYVLKVDLTVYPEDKFIVEILKRLV